MPCGAPPLHCCLARQAPITMHLRVTPHDSSNSDPYTGACACAGMCTHWLRALQRHSRQWWACSMLMQCDARATCNGLPHLALVTSTGCARLRPAHALPRWGAALTWFSAAEQPHCFLQVSLLSRAVRRSLLQARITSAANTCTACTASAVSEKDDYVRPAVNAIFLSPCEKPVRLV